MSAPGSCLARQMRPHLGAALWGEFVAHANRHYKARWLRAFAPASGVLRCVGALDGAPCAHGALVDLRDRGAGTGGEWGRAEREVGAALERLHLDHERPLHATCHRWRAAMPAAPRSWDDGLDGAALCHDLFGVCASAAHGPARVCAFGAARRATPRGWCCSLWTTRTAAIDRSWARLLGRDIVMYHRLYVSPDHTSDRLGLRLVMCHVDLCYPARSCRLRPGRGGTGCA